MDFGKGSAIHRLYGHSAFIREAKRAKKNRIFIKNICNNLRCDGTDKNLGWRNHLVPNTFSDR